VATGPDKSPGACKPDALLLPYSREKRIIKTEHRRKKRRKKTKDGSGFGESLGLKKTRHYEETTLDA